jgi:hypothetical protein
MAEFLLTEIVMNTLLPSQGVNYEIVFGRWLAVCCHPICAWRVRSRLVRTVVVASYFSAGYLTVLTALLMSR